MNAITQFIDTADSGKVISGSTENDFTGVKLHATLSRAVALLENQRNECPGMYTCFRGVTVNHLITNLKGPDTFDSLAQCTTVLSKETKVPPIPGSDVLRSLERLRRACGKVFENANSGDELKTAVKSLLVVILGKMELCMHHQVK